MKLKEAFLNNLFWKVIGLFFVFMNNLIIVRSLGVEYNGVLFLTIAYFTLFITCFRFGFENGILYITSKYRRSSTGLFYFLIPFAIVQSEVVIFILKFIPQAGQPLSTKVATLYIIAGVLQYYMGAFFASKKMFKSYNVINTLLLVFQFVLLGLFYLKISGTNSIDTKWPMDVVFNIMTISTFLNIVVLFAYYYYKNDEDFKEIRLEKGVLKLLFRISAIIYISNILYFLVTRIDFYFVDRYSSAIELGNYVQSSKIGQMLLLLPGVIGSIVFPYAINADKIFAEKVAYFCRLITIIFFGFFVVLLLTGKFMLPWLLGEKFDLVYSIMLMQIGGIFFTGINLVLISYFEGKNGQTIILFAYLINLALMVVLNILFTPTYGYKSSALIFSASCFATNLFLTFMFVKSTGISLDKVYKITVRDLRDFHFLNKDQ